MVRLDPKRLAGGLRLALFSALAMINRAYDREAATLVLCVWNDELDYELEVFRKSVLVLDGDAARSQRIPVTILEVVEAERRPNAEQRRLMAEMWHQMTAPKHVFALVTGSAVARGVFTVVNWLNPPGARRREAIHATFARAAQWAERERGEALPVLAALHQQARAARASQRPQPKK